MTLRTLRRLGLAVLSLGIGAVALSPLDAPSSETSAIRGSIQATPPAAVATPEPTPSPPPVFRPVAIELPTLGVNAPVIPVGIEPDGAMGTPRTAHEVAWWDGVEVGGGNALLAGHKDWRRRPGSFFRIGELRPGDPIVVGGDGVSLRFAVEWVKQVPADAAAEEFLGDAGRPVVTLITCGGEFDRSIRHYKDRVVVRAVLAG